MLKVITGISKCFAALLFMIEFPNYFDISRKLFLGLLVAKFLHSATKSLFPHKNCERVPITHGTRAHKHSHWPLPKVCPLSKCVNGSCAIAPCAIGNHSFFNTDMQ